MKKVISQSAAVAASVAVVAGSADGIIAAAIGAHKANGKLSDHIRTAFAAPVPVLSATLSAVFIGLDKKLTPKAGHNDESRAVWATIANSVATHVRNLWNKLPEGERPALCYIALNRADCTANVQVLAKPTKQELKNVLGHDQKALNAAMARIHSATTTPGGQTINPKPAPAPAAVIGAVDSHAPKGGVLAGLIVQLGTLSLAEKHELAKQLESMINAETAARLEASEKKGRGPSANAKPNAKSRGETQAKAKEVALAKVA